MKASLINLTKLCPSNTAWLDYVIFRCFKSQSILASVSIKLLKRSCRYLQLNFLQYVLQELPQSWHALRSPVETSNPVRPHGDGDYTVLLEIFSRMVIVFCIFKNSTLISFPVSFFDILPLVSYLFTFSSSNITLYMIFFPIHRSHNNC